MKLRNIFIFSFYKAYYFPHSLVIFSIIFDKNSVYFNKCYAFIKICQKQTFFILSQLIALVECIIFVTVRFGIKK